MAKRKYRVYSKKRYMSALQRRRTLYAVLIAMGIGITVMAFQFYKAMAIPVIIVVVVGISTFLIIR